MNSFLFSESEAVANVHCGTKQLLVSCFWLSAQKKTPKETDSSLMDLPVKLCFCDSVSPPVHWSWCVISGDTSSTHLAKPTGSPVPTQWIWIIQFSCRNSAFLKPWGTDQSEMKSDNIWHSNTVQQRTTFLVGYETDSQTAERIHQILEWLHSNETQWAICHTEEHLLHLKVPQHENCVGKSGTYFMLNNNSHAGGRGKMNVA